MHLNCGIYKSIGHAQSPELINSGKPSTSKIKSIVNETLETPCQYNTLDLLVIEKWNFANFIISVFFNCDLFVKK